MKTTFTQKEKQILSEIWRRVFILNNGYLDTTTVNTNLLYLAYPGEAAIIAKYGLIQIATPFEHKRVLNWYKLTEKGKAFFKKYENVIPITEDLNLLLFEKRKILNFKYTDL